MLELCLKAPQPHVPLLWFNRGLLQLLLRILIQTQKYCETHFQRYDWFLSALYEELNENTKMLQKPISTLRLASGPLV